MKITLILACCALLLIGCDKQPSVHSDKPDVTHLLADAIPANPFPEATEVRLYINKNYIEVDNRGKLSADSFPTEGIPLNAAEINQIRNAVYFAKPPSPIAGCCDPRHAFLFYDKTHHFLGSLTVCFECGCSVLKGGRLKRPAGHSHITWNEDVFANVIKAHNQSTTPYSTQ